MFNQPGSRKNQTRSVIKYSHCIFRDRSYLITSPSNIDIPLMFSSRLCKSNAGLHQQQAELADSLHVPVVCKSQFPGTQRRSKQLTLLMLEPGLWHVLVRHKPWHNLQHSDTCMCGMCESIKTLCLLYDHAVHFQPWSTTHFLIIFFPINGAKALTIWNG